MHPPLRYTPPGLSAILENQIGTNINMLPFKGVSFVEARSPFLVVSKGNNNKRKFTYWRVPKKDTPILLGGQRSLFKMDWAMRLLQDNMKQVTGRASIQRGLPEQSMGIPNGDNSAVAVVGFGFPISSFLRFSMPPF